MSCSRSSSESCRPHVCAPQRPTRPRAGWPSSRAASPSRPRPQPPSWHSRRRRPRPPRPSSRQRDAATAAVSDDLAKAREQADAARALVGSLEGDLKAARDELASWASALPPPNPPRAGSPSSRAASPSRPSRPPPWPRSSRVAQDKAEAAETQLEERDAAASSVTADLAKAREQADAARALVGSLEDELERRARNWRSSPSSPRPQLRPSGGSRSWTGASRPRPRWRSPRSGELALAREQVEAPRRSSRSVTRPRPPPTAISPRRASRRESARTRAVEALESELAALRDRAELAGAAEQRVAALEAQLVERDAEASAAAEALAEARDAAHRLEQEAIELRGASEALAAARSELEDGHEQTTTLRSELERGAEPAGGDPRGRRACRSLENELAETRATLADARVKIDDARAERARVPELEAGIAERRPSELAELDGAGAVARRACAGRRAGGRGRARADGPTGTRGRPRERAGRARRSARASSSARRRRCRSATPTSIA